MDIQRIQMPAVSSFALGGSVVMRRWLLFVLLVIPFVVMLALVVEADDPSSEEGPPPQHLPRPGHGRLSLPAYGYADTSTYS